MKIQLKHRKQSGEIWLSKAVHCIAVHMIKWLRCSKESTLSSCDLTLHFTISSSSTIFTRPTRGEGKDTYVWVWFPPQPGKNRGQLLSPKVNIIYGNKPVCIPHFLNTIHKQPYLQLIHNGMNSAWLNTNTSDIWSESWWMRQHPSHITFCDVLSEEKRQREIKHHNNSLTFSAVL